MASDSHQRLAVEYIELIQLKEDFKGGDLEPISTQKSFETFTVAIDWSKVQTKTVVAVMDLYSEAELKTVNQMLKTAAGRLYIKKQRMLQERVNEIGLALLLEPE